MKFVVVKMVRETRPEFVSKGHQVRYPDEYDALEVHVSVRGPHIYDGGILLYQGEAEELLLCLPAEMVDRWTKANPGGFRELSSAEAELWMAANRQVQAQPAEIVTDAGANRLMAVMAKALVSLVQKQGLEVPAEDLASLDPDHAEPGVGRAKKTIEDHFDTAVLAKVLAVEGKADLAARVGLDDAGAVSKG